MKKLFLPIVILSTVATLAFIACNKISQPGISSNNAETNKKSLKRETFNNSAWTRGLGVTEIASDTPDAVYSISAVPVNINAVPVDLDDATFTLTESGNVLTISVSLPTAIGQVSSISLELNGNTGQVTDLSNNTVIDSPILNAGGIAEIKYYIAMALVDVIKNPNTETPEPSSMAPTGCNRTIMSCRISKSRAVAFCNAATNAFCTAHTDCSPIFGVDTGCLWGDYFCVATQEIHCTGSGCSATSL